jgi:uncharacterized protein (DUF2235 family)
MATEQPADAKNIVLLSDGTGNAASKVWRSNVWRLFQALDLTNSRQVAVYDDGVGTSSFVPLAVLGGAFGWGLKRNVLDLYTFLCRNYEPGAKIYAFGFSRGAYTIRIMLGLVANQGLVHYTNEADLQRLAVQAYRAYRKERFHSITRVETVLRWVRDGIIRLADSLHRRPRYGDGNIWPPDIEFVGLWDTVGAYGLPVEEMTRGVSQWIWPLELPDRVLGPRVKRACHALSLDDERTTFHPVLWTEWGEKPPTPRPDGRVFARDERISQVWFAGMHANVGGGYPDDSLAQVSLYWMMQEAGYRGLRFKAAPVTDPDAVLNTYSGADRDGRLYDSRRGMAGYYRYGPRKIAELCKMRFSQRPGDEVIIGLPKIHESALVRTKNGAHAYAPIGFPETYGVVRQLDGEIVAGTRAGFESPQQAATRAAQQERIWDLVWCRRGVYFLTLTASFHLALFPILHPGRPSNEFSTSYRLVSDAVRIVGAFLPGFAGWWLDAFAVRPRAFLFSLVPVVLFMYVGVALGRTINSRMHFMWRTILRHGEVPPGPVTTSVIHAIRTSAVYRGVVRLMKRYVVPFASAAFLVYLGAAALTHLAFDVQDARGVFCQESAGAPQPVELWAPRQANFRAASLCERTGIGLREGFRYRIIVHTPEDWSYNRAENPLDTRFSSPAVGFELRQLPRLDARLFMMGALPLRRVLGKPWFRPVARIGAVGADEYPLEPDVRAPGADLGSVDPRARGELVAEIRARRSGELFIYVNDAVVGIPGLENWFYRNNLGEAKVTVSRLGIR